VDETKDSDTKGKVLQILYSTEEAEEKAATDAEAGEAAEGGEAHEDAPTESLLDSGVAEGELLAAEEPAAF